MPYAIRLKSTWKTKIQLEIKIKQLLNELKSNSRKSVVFVELHFADIFEEQISTMTIHVQVHGSTVSTGELCSHGKQVKTTWYMRTQYCEVHRKLCVGQTLSTEFRRSMLY